MPTRGRTVRLFTAIKSILDTTKPGQVEILLRLDEDDSRSCSMKEELAAMGCVIITGPRLNGYTSLPTFNQELSDKAQSYWVMLFNDDAIIEGAGWVDQIQHYGESDAVFQAEHHWLGGSHYHHDSGGPFPVLPRNCWQRFGWAEPPSDADRWVAYYLNNEKRWPLNYLKGIAVRHNR